MKPSRYSALKLPKVRSVPSVSKDDAVDFGVRETQKFVDQPQFVHDPQRARMYGVAAEVAQKVIVLFQHGDVDPGAGQQKSVHHARGPAAGDTHLGPQTCVMPRHYDARSTRSGYLPVGSAAP